MNEEPENLPEPDENPLLAETISWCLRMHGPDAHLHQAAFDSWIALGGVHRQIYSEVSELYGFGETLRGLDLRRSPAVDETMMDMPPQSSREKFVVVALVILGMVIGGFYLLGAADRGWSTEIARFQSRHPRQIQTGLGEISAFRTIDGSLITLDTDTLVIFNLGSDERRFRIERGRARFAPAGMERPFIVSAGSHAILAQGSPFDVTFLAGEAVSVSPLRGAVRIRALDRSGRTGHGHEMRLAAGQLAIYRPGDAIAIRRASSFSNVVDPWPSGVVAFNGVALSEVLRQANRYATTKIYLSNPRLGARPFHGTLRMAETRTLSRTLARALELRAVEKEGVIWLQPK